MRLVILAAIAPPTSGFNDYIYRERNHHIMSTHTVTISNRENATYVVDSHRPLLDTLRSHGVDLPYGCKYGGCITCAAKLISGEVNQSRQVALNARQLADGYIILCVARPLSDITLEIGVESHDTLYINPFLHQEGH